VFLRFRALGGIAPSFRHSELNTFEVVINVLPLFSLYLEKLLLPINLNALYVFHPVHSLIEFKWIFSCAVTVAYAYLAHMLFKKNRAIFLSMMIIIFPLLPAFYIRGLGDNVIAERYLYLPSVGFAMITGSLVTSRICTSNSIKKSIIAILILSLAIYAVSSVRRNQIWHDDVTLWKDTVKKSPDSNVVHCLLGVALAKEGNLDEAVTEYNKALKVTPDYFEVHSNLGNILSRQGHLDEAIKHYREALRIRSNFFHAHYNLGVALLEKGNLDSAIEEFQEALQLKPNFAEAHYSLGLTYAARGDFDASIQEFQKTLQLDSGHDDARNSLNMAIAQRKQ
jgi:tetratricopeptide (TPR) repeat protein